MNRHRSTLAAAGSTVAALMLVAACGGGSSPTGQPSPLPASAAPTATAAPSTPTPAPTAAAVPLIVMTVEDGACQYDGPTSIQYGAYEVGFIVRDTSATDFGWFVFTLAPGRTVEEARAAFALDEPPDWLTVLTVHPFETTGTAAVARENLRHMGAYTGGPVYFLCAQPDRILGLFGPIEVIGG